MEQELKINDKVFIINKKENNFIIEENIISGININCNNEQEFSLKSIDNKRCKFLTYKNCEIFKTKIEAEKYLQSISQKSNLKISDIVIFDKKFKNKNIYQIINYDIDFNNNIIRYRLNRLYNNFGYDYDLDNIEIIDKNLLKLDVKRFKELFDYKELIEKLDLIYKEYEKIQKQVFEFEDEIKNKFDLILSYEHKHYLLDFLNKTPMFKNIFYKEKLEK